MFDNREQPVGLRRKTLVTGAETDTQQVFQPEPFDTVSSYSHGLPPIALAKMQHTKETPLFMACAVISGLCYLYLGTSLLISMMMPAAAVLIIFGVVVGIPMLVLLALLGKGLLSGHIKGTCLRISPRQLPQVHQAVETMSARLGIEAPAVYVMESGGLLNAFATRLLRKYYVILYSDVVEMAFEQGEEALNFVVGHELAHIARGHLRNRWLIHPVELVLPLLSMGYYRACEYSCDLIAAHCAPKGAVDGLMALSAGKKLRHHVDASIYAAQMNTENSFWVWLAELFATHPNLPKRVDAVMNLSIVQQQQLSNDSQQLAPVA